MSDGTKQTGDSEGQVAVLDGTPVDRLFIYQYPMYTTIVNVIT